MTGYTVSGSYRRGFFYWIGLDGAIINTGFYGDVSAQGPVSIAGGIAAMNYGKITNCSFSGSVSGADDTGGLVGENNGLVRNCFSSGTVDGVIAAGGIAGYTYTESVIQNCYSAATVTGATYKGGLVGGSIGGQMNNCYWLLSGCANGYGSSGDTVTNISSFDRSGALASSMGGSNILLDVLNVYAQPDSDLMVWVPGTGAYAYPVLEYRAYKIQAAPASLDFGMATLGYTPPVAQTITITNTGNQAVTITQPTATNYTVGALSATSVALAGTATFTVQPKTGLAVGTYNEAIYIAGSNGASASVQLAFTVTDAPVYGISASPILKNFGSVPQGYAPPAAETVTITNTGNQAVTITQPTATNYTVGMLSATTIALAGTATFTVQPKAGLAFGTYNEAISISGSNGVSALVQFGFTVNAATPTPIPYRVISGAGGTYHQQGPSGLTFTANGDFDHFTGIQVDGDPMDESDYDAREGSTIITLHPDYMDSLTFGTHQIRILFTDGYADASFTAAEELDPVMPPTGDSNTIAFFGALIILSATALMVFCTRRRKANR